ncbi:MAG: radical SAM protein [Candidatus Pacearchaeota archaeon]|nr:radical SAM protein [Candidatus Pacearchaeota archaeon]
MTNKQEKKNKVKVTFIYYDATERSGRCYMVGISIIATMLKKAGHQVSLIHISDKISQEELIEKAKNENSDIYAFTSISLIYPRIRQYARAIKKSLPDKMTMIGGVHAILNPEEAIKDFDAVCIGEGEYCTVELADKIASKKPYLNTKNFWFKIKEKGKEKIIQNERLPLIENLDELPYPDREIWDYYNLSDYQDAKQITIMASRGCPYMCTYCFNHKIRELYPNKNKWVRFRSVDHVMKEIKETLNKYPGDYKQIRFIDDTIVQDKKWFEEFSKKITQFGLGISCQARANELTEEIVKKLSQIGVKRVEMGIEAGNEFIRNKIMKRYMSDEQIINAFNWCKKYGIQTTSFNIMGLPFETIEMMLDTVKINVLAKSIYPYSFVFQPFPKTEAWQIAKDFGFLKEKSDAEYESLFEGSPLNCPHFKPEEAKFIQAYFRKLIKLYRIKILWPFFDFIIVRKLLPFKTLIRLENIINFPQYFSRTYPDATKKIKKFRFWRRDKLVS